MQYRFHHNVKKSLKASHIIFIAAIIVVMSSNACAQTTGDYIAQAQAALRSNDYEEAIKLCTRALQLNPQSAEAYSLRGQAGARSNMFFLALIDFNQAIAINPREASNYRFRASIKFHLAESEEALFDLDTANRLEPNNADVFNLRAAIYMQEGDTSVALQNVNQALKIQPVFVDALQNRAFIYVAQKQWPKAIQDFSEAIRLDSQNALAVAGRASAYGFIGDTVAALRDLDRAIFLDSASSYLRLRAFLHRDTLQAIADLDGAIAIDESDPENYFWRGRYCEIVLKDSSRALSDFVQSIRLHPAYLPALMAAAHLKMRFGEVHSAIEDVTQAIMVDSEEASLYSWRGSLRAWARDTLGAFVDYAIALGIKKTDSLALAQRAALFEARGLIDSAIADLDRLTKVFPSEDEIVDRKANVEFDNGRFEQALPDYDRAIELNPNNSSYWNDRGATHKKLKHYTKAIEDYEHSLALRPNNTNTLCNLANARAAVHDNKGAFKAWEQSIAVDRSYYGAWNDRAIFREQLGDFRAALRDYDTAILYEPLSFSALDNRGILRMKLGDTSGALEDFDAVLDHEADIRALDNRGEILSNRGKNDEALQDFSRAVKLDPSDFDAWFGKGRVEIELGKNREAVNSFTKALAIDSTDAEAYRNRAIAWERLNENANSANDFAKAGSIAPRIQEERKAEEALDNDRYAEAIEHATKSVEHDTAGVTPFYYRARAYAQLNRWREAIADYELIKKIDPNQTDVDRYIAYAKIQLGNDHGAAAMLDTLLRKHPEDLVALEEHALIQFNKGDLRGAVQDFTTVILRDSTFTQAYENRAVVRQQLQDIPGALSDILRAAAVKPTLHVLKTEAEIMEKAGYDTSVVTAYTGAMALDSSDLWLWIQRGSFYWRKHRLDAAEQDFRFPLTRNPEFEPSYLMLGNIYTDRKLLDSAVLLFSHALLLNPRDSVALTNRGIAFDLKGLHNEAIKDYTTSLQIAPHYIDARRWRGRSYERLQLWAQALNDQDSVLATDPSNPVYAADCGYTQLLSKDYEGSIQYYARAIRSDSNHASYWYHRAVAKQGLGDLSMYEDLDRAIEIDPENAEYVRVRGNWRMKKGDTVGAKNDLLDVSRTAPNDVVSILSTVSLYESQQDWASALNYSERALAIEPKNVTALQARANSLIQLQRLTEAASAVEDFAAAAGPTAGTFELRGDVYMMQKRYANGLTEFSLALQKAKTVGAYYGHGFCAYGLKLDSLCIKDLSMALRLNPKHYSSLFLRAVMLAKNHDHEGAIQDYTRCLEIKPTNHLFFLYRALEYDAIKRTDAARADAQQGQDAISQLDSVRTAQIQQLLGK